MVALTQKQSCVQYGWVCHGQSHNMVVVLQQNFHFLTYIIWLSALFLTLYDIFFSCKALDSFCQGVET